MALPLSSATAAGPFYNLKYSTRPQFLAQAHAHNHFSLKLVLGFTFVLDLFVFLLEFKPSLTYVPEILT